MLILPLLLWQNKKFRDQLKFGCKLDVVGVRLGLISYYAGSFLHFPSEMRKKMIAFEKKSLDSFLIWYTINMCRNYQVYNDVDR